MNHPFVDPLLVNYKPWNDDEAAYCGQLRQFLDYGWNHYDRSNLVAHIITDAWVVNPERSKVLLVEYAGTNIWLAPGGHADGSPDVINSAMRETVEETGLKPHHLKPLLSGGLLDVNVFTVPDRQKPHGLEPQHIHFDLCFAFEAPENAPLTISDESSGLSWKPVSEALEIMMPCHRRRAEKTLAGVLKS